MRSTYSFRIGVSHLSSPTRLNCSNRLSPQSGRVLFVNRTERCESFERSDPSDNLSNSICWNLLACSSLDRFASALITSKLSASLRFERSVRSVRLGLCRFASVDRKSERGPNLSPGRFAREPSAQSSASHLTGKSLRLCGRADGRQHSPERSLGARTQCNRTEAAR